MKFAINLLGDVNNFGPFNAGVWGTVSDWLIVITTIVTIIFLIKTFISQKKQLFMERESALTAQMPIFSVSVANPSSESIEFSFKGLTNFAQSVAAHFDMYPKFYQISNLADMFGPPEEDVEHRIEMIYLGDIFPGQEKKVTLKLVNEEDMVIRFSLIYFDIARSQQYIQYFKYEYPKEKLSQNMPIKYSKEVSLIGGGQRMLLMFNINNSGFNPTGSQIAVRKINIETSLSLG